MNYSHVDVAFHDAITDLVNCRVIGSRNGPMREIVGWQFSIPGSSNWLSNERRALSPGYAAAETLWYLSGSSDVTMIAAYAPKYRRFAESNGHAHGAYGARLSRHEQLENVLHLLTSRRESRQAVCALWYPDELFSSEAFPNAKRDVPCTLSWQFLLRDESLHMVATMRSNDVWLGLPYDVFAFTCVQRLLAGTLGVRVGTYVHQVGSLHLYEKNYEAAQESLRSPCYFLEHEWSMIPDDNFLGVRTALWTEELFRGGKATESVEHGPVGEMLGDLLVCVASHWGGSTYKTRSPALTKGIQTHADHRRSRPGRQDDAVQEDTSAPLHDA